MNNSTVDIPTFENGSRDFDLPVIQGAGDFPPRYYSVSIDSMLEGTCSRTSLGDCRILDEAISIIMAYVKANSDDFDTYLNDYYTLHYRGYVKYYGYIITLDFGDLNNIGRIAVY